MILEIILSCPRVFLLPVTISLAARVRANVKKVSGGGHAMSCCQLVSIAVVFRGEPVTRSVT